MNTNALEIDSEAPHTYIDDLGGAQYTKPCPRWCAVQHRPDENLDKGMYHRREYVRDRCQVGLTQAEDREGADEPELFIDTPPAETVTLGEAEELAHAILSAVETAKIEATLDNLRQRR